jgi:hypothetical protein
VIGNKERLCWNFCFEGKQEKLQSKTRKTTKRMVKQTQELCDRCYKKSVYKILFLLWRDSNSVQSSQISTFPWSLMVRFCISVMQDVKHVSGSDKLTLQVHTHGSGLTPPTRW